MRVPNSAALSSPLLIQLRTLCSWTPKRPATSTMVSSRLARGATVECRIDPAMGNSAGDTRRVIRGQDRTITGPHRHCPIPALTAWRCPVRGWTVASASVGGTDRKVLEDDLEPGAVRGGAHRTDEERWGLGQARQAQQRILLSVDGVAHLDIRPAPADPQPQG